MTLNNGVGNLDFLSFSTLSVGLNQGNPNDQLVDAAGNVTIAPGARLTAYAGRGDLATGTPVLTATAGTLTGFFALTVDPLNNNAPHVFLMGTDLMVPTYAANAVSVVEGGTLAPATGAVGFEPDSDKFVITASTGAAAQLVTARDVNGALDVVVRNAPGAVTLTITTTKNLGDGLTAIGGIAVDGGGAATIVAANTTSNTSGTGLSPFGDVIVQGALTALTLHDFLGGVLYQSFIAPAAPMPLDQHHGSDLRLRQHQPADRAEHADAGPVHQRHPPRHGDGRTLRRHQDHRPCQHLHAG